MRSIFGLASGAALLAGCAGNPAADGADPRWDPYRGCEATLTKTVGGELWWVEERTYDRNGDLIEQIYDEYLSTEDTAGSPPDGEPDLVVSSQFDDRHRLLGKQDDSPIDGVPEAAWAWTYEGDATIAARMDYDNLADGSVDERYYYTIEQDDATGRVWVQSYRPGDEGTRYVEVLREDGQVASRTVDGDPNADGVIETEWTYTYEGSELVRVLMRRGADEEPAVDDRWTWQRGLPVRIDHLTEPEPTFEELDWRCR